MRVPGVRLGRSLALPPATLAALFPLRSQPPPVIANLAATSKPPPPPTWAPFFPLRSHPPPATANLAATSNPPPAPHPPPPQQLAANSPFGAPLALAAPGKRLRCHLNRRTAPPAAWRHPSH